MLDQSACSFRPSYELIGNVILLCRYAKSAHITSVVLGPNQTLTAGVSSIVSYGAGITQWSSGRRVGQRWEQSTGCSP